MRTRNAFTLIELLIVVAIIAILAAIAVPNFLEAQVRSKVSRCKADMRSITTALESYAVDNNHYPPDGAVPNSLYPRLILLTTPVAYLTSLPNDPFAEKIAFVGVIPSEPKGWRYTAEAWKALMILADPSPPFLTEHSSAATWALASFGPDLKNSWGEWLMFGQDVLDLLEPEVSPLYGTSTWGCLYDPTNGTISDGDIVRIGP